MEYQKGVGLVEVLVALFILAIGVLGFSALQLRALQATTEATDRTMAMTVARDLTDRMRINRLALADYETAINNKATETDCVGSAVSYKPACDKTKMAKYDAKQILDKAVFTSLFFRLAADGALRLDGVCDMYDVHADDNLVFAAAVDRADDTVNFFYFFKVYLALVFKINAQPGGAVCQKRNVVYAANRLQNFFCDVFVIHFILP